MNYKVLIHAIILIFIFHILILNLDYEITIGKRNKKEHFNNCNSKNNTNEKNETKETLDFLNTQTKDEDFFKKMNELSSDDSQNETNEFLEKNELPVLPSNGYLNDENRPNFESNVADTPKFYKINNPYDELNEDQLKTNISDLNKTSKNVINEKINIDNQVRQSTENPNHWEYNNEFAMNGGTMGGIVGFDGLESQYAGFGSLLDLKENSNEKNENNIPHDDLRKPIVYEN
jgi:hypothetical protein